MREIYKILLHLPFIQICKGMCNAHVITGENKHVNKSLNIHVKTWVYILHYTNINLGVNINVNM